MSRNIFINREAEKDTIERFIYNNSQNKPRLLIYSTLPASGMTYFLRHVIEKTKKDENVLCFYIDGNQAVMNNIYSQFLLQLGQNYPEWSDWMKNSFSKSKGLNWGELFAAAMEGIPFAGAFLREFTEQKIEKPNAEIKPLYSGGFASLQAEVISNCLAEINSKKKIIFFIDNLQDLDRWSLSLIKTTISTKYSNLYYVAALTNGTNIDSGYDRNSVSFLNPVLNAYKGVREKFTRPTSKFIKELSQVYGKNISFLDAETIYKNTNGEIYHVERILSDPFFQEPQKSLSVLHNEIIKLLLCAKQPLRISDIKNIVIGSNDIFISNVSDINNAIGELVDWGLILRILISNASDIIEINKSNSSEILSLKHSEDLRVSEKLFTYFSKAEKNSIRHSEVELYPILYRLSQKVRRGQTKGYLLKLVSLGMSISYPDLESNLLKEILSDHVLTFEDFTIKCIFLFTSKKYKELFDVFRNSNYGIWQTDRNILLIKAITLNRLRKHAQSEQIIINLLKSGCTKEERVSLMIYYISGLLHQNKLEEASQIFLEEYDLLKDAKNFGYFLRNGASTQSSTQAIDLLKRAVDFFKSTNDFFGLASAWNNLGVNYIRLNQLERAETSLKSAEETFENFGVAHLYIILNNLGILHLLQNRNEIARKYFLRAEAVSNAIMPTIFIRINEAILNYVDGNRKSSFSNLQDLKKLVDEHPVERVRQKFYFNYCILMFLENHVDKEKYRQLALKYPLRENPSLINEKLSLLISKSENNKFILQLIEPCHLVYWYHNPLDIYN